MKTLFVPLIALLGFTLAGTSQLQATAQPDTAGIMTVSDRGNAFTETGITKAKDAFRDTTFHARTEFHVEVYGKIPESKRADFEKVKSDTPAKNRFFGDWANELAKAHNSKGIFLLVSREGSHIHAIDDRQTDAKRSSNFDDKKLKQLQEKLLAGFAKAGKLPEKDGAEAKQFRDEALLDATNYVIAELKDTTLPATKDAVKHDGGNKAVNNIWGYVCIGAVVLLGIWLVVGIFRALTNRGGGGGGGYGGGGYGGGGGGFMSGMLGGLFGGLAGMWMYNHMFGGGSSVSDMSAGQGGDYGGNSGGDYNDTGAGDYDGGGDGGGSNYDEGGGDTGGGSDTGGGGDWGDSGGGGDYGGGGDSGGGGDFGGGGGDW